MPFVNGTYVPPTQTATLSADAQGGAAARAKTRKAAITKKAGNDAAAERRRLGVNPTYNAVPTATPSDTEWLKTDAGFTETQNLANRAAARFGTGQRTAAEQYGRDYDKAAQTLGFDPATGKWVADVGEGRRSGYNRATQGTAGNFAARGMLQGSDFLRADDDVRAEFGQRQADMLQGRADFATQQQQDLSGFQEEQQAVLDQARREALARRVGSARSGLFL